MSSQLRLLFALPLLLSLGFAPGARAGGDPNACDEEGDSPNVIVGDLYEILRYGKVGDITGFSVGTISCNVGTCWLQWLTGSGDTRHPTIGQNAFRLKDGRFEQIGQSWLKHGFYALSQRLCSNDCLSTDGDYLGVNCSDPYSASLNGDQSRLGPKFEVNATTGVHPHPVSMQNRTGDDIFKRLQIHDSDLDPALNAGALYFVEGQYVAADDAAAGNHHDNASYRPVTVAETSPGRFDLIFAGPTVRTDPAILAWKAADPSVLTTFVDDPQGGRYWLAAKATDLGNGTWSYEYAVQNLDSHLSAGWFSIPTSPSVTMSDKGFHDVDYHSGEPFDLTDWAPTRESSGSITWNTVPYGTNPNANALRWGTLYNFRFVADAPPAPAVVSLGMFKPGNPGDARRIGAVLIAPLPCNADGTCDPGESCISCPDECPGGPPDIDGDGVSFCEDCNDNDTKSWATPGETRMLMAWRGPAGEVEMNWQQPAEPGSTALRFEVLRSEEPSNFETAVTCLRDPDPMRRELSDAGAPTAGPFLSYLVRALNTCAIGRGTTGWNSLGVERLAADCP